VLASGFALVQAVLPVVIWATAGSGPRDFSWDMFSHYLQCRRFEVRAQVARTGAPVVVDLGHDFTSWAQLSRLLAPGRMQVYAQSLCARLQGEAHEQLRLSVLTECRSAHNADWAPVLDSDSDYCRPSR
jgi:hypothetical protein